MPGGLESPSASRRVVAVQTVAATLTVVAVAAGFFALYALRGAWFLLFGAIVIGIAARPAIVYWRPATLALLAEVAGLRQAGVVAWATMDAGPHVKVLTTADDADTVARALLAIAGVTAVTISEVGGPAEVVA